MAILRIVLLPVGTLIVGFLLTATNSETLSPHAAAYPEKLSGAFTGGFGEETCHSCHFDYPLNPEEGSLSIEGIPDNYQPGKSYKIKISIRRDDLDNAGFQLSSRFEDGNQAGSFQANSDRLSFTKVNSTIQYLQHSTEGANTQNSNSTFWEFTWIAPDSAAENIIYNLAVNAGNGDVSAFGDYIFIREIKINSTTGQ